MPTKDRHCPEEDGVFTKDRHYPEEDGVFTKDRQCPEEGGVPTEDRHCSDGRGALNKGRIGAEGAAGGAASKDPKGAARWKAGILVAVAAAFAVAAIVYFTIGRPEAAGNKSEPVSVQVGETVLFGSYLNEDIEWRVLRISEDETQAVLVAAHILTMKAYGAAESGCYNYAGDKNFWTRESEADTDMVLQAQVRGNSDWSVSNLRTWLNADTEVVAYSDQLPAATAMAEKKNGYVEDVTRQENVGLEGFGVRPALVVDLRLVKFRGAESGE